MGGFREAIKRFAGGDPAFNRRGLLVAGGGVMAAILAACADHSAKPQVPEGGAQTPTTVTIAPPPVNDVTLLRTASSIEILAVQTYQKGIDSGLLTTPALARRREAVPRSAPRPQRPLHRGDDRGRRRAVHRGRTRTSS